MNVNLLTTLCVVLISVKSLQCTPAFVNTYIDEASRKSLHEVFNGGINSKDISIIHYGIDGLLALGAELNTNQEQIICATISKQNTIDSLEGIYHLLSIESKLKDCSGRAKKELAEQFINEALENKKCSSKEIFLALSVAKLASVAIDQKEFASLLKARASNESSSVGLAYCVNGASLLSKDLAEQFLSCSTKLMARTEEVDGKYLKVDRGLNVTALAVNGIYLLAEKLNKKPDLTNNEVIKFANYLLSRRHIRAEQVAYFLVSALRLLSTNQYQIPVAFSIASKMGVTDNTQPLKIRFSNLLGGSVGALTVTLNSMYHTTSKEKVIVKSSLEKDAKDMTGTIYELKMDQAKHHGQYSIDLTATSQSKSLIGMSNVAAEVKLMAKIRLEDIHISVFDREFSTPPSTDTVKDGSKLGKVLEADTHSKMIIKFKVKDLKSGNAITVHQAFVAFVHQKTKREIIYVATVDTTRNYIFDLDFHKSGQDFEGVSGKYSVHLVIGDFYISSSLDWNLVDINLKLPLHTSPPVKKSEQIIYHPLPAINHLFREPEKRPPQVVSNTFTVLCILPLFILLVLWLSIGINFRSMPASIYPVLFHLGLTAIFGLYFWFWLRLTMFETLKHLTVLATFTFVVGNRLLRRLALDRIK